MREETFQGIESGLNDAIGMASRELGFYWVRHVALWVAEWNGRYWYLPGIEDHYTDEHFTYIADQPIKASIE